MFIPTEDLILSHYTAWHGTALAWNKCEDMYISQLPIVSDRFCGIRYSNSLSNVSILVYSAYFPTRGQDDDFLEMLSILFSDITNNQDEDCSLMIGADTNQSPTSTIRRQVGWQNFLLEHHLQSVISTNEPTCHHNN